MEKNKLIVKLKEKSIEKNMQGIIASYLLRNIKKLNDKSITNIALQTETTPSSITKFVNSLGVNGYKELKTIFSENENLSFQKYHKKIKENINFLNLQMEKIKLLIQEIKESKKVYFIGFGNNKLPIDNFIYKISNFFSGKFLRINSREDYFIYEDLNNCLIIHVTFSNSHNDINKYLRSVKKNMKKNIWKITSVPSNQFNNIHLLNNEETYPRGWGCNISLNYLFNIILLEINK